jgi:hypothetical protein
MTSLACELKIKKVTNDWVVDAKVVINSPYPNTHQQTNTQQPHQKNAVVAQPQQEINHTIKNVNDQHGLPPQYNFPQKHKYTQLCEPIKMIMQKLIQAILIMLPMYENYREPQVKPPWYNDISTISKK